MSAFFGSADSKQVARFCRRKGVNKAERRECAASITTDDTSNWSYCQENSYWSAIRTTSKASRMADCDCHDPSTTRAGAQKPSAGKKPARSGRDDWMLC